MKNLLLFLFAFSASPVQAQTDGDYRSAATGNWNTVSTWQRFNGATTTWQSAVAAPAATDGTITIRSPHTVTVSGTAAAADGIVVDAGGTLSASSSTLTLADGTGADLVCNGTLQLGGTITGAGSGLINGTMNWTGGNLTAPFSIAPAGTLNLTGTGTKFLNEALTNGGTIAWSGGSFTLNNGTLTNNATFNNSFDGVLGTLGGGTNLFLNNGTFTKTAGTGTTSVNINSTNSGTISVATGMVSNGQANTNAGTVIIAAASTFRNTGTLNLNTGTVLSGSGTLQLNGIENINISVNLAATLLLGKTAGTATGTLPFTLNGTMDWTGGTVDLPFTIVSAATCNLSGGSTKFLADTLTNEGTVTWSGGSFTINDGKMINNNTFNASADGQMNSTAGIADFLNTGTFSKTGGTGSTFIRVSCTNSGTVYAGSGTVENNRTLTNTGTIGIAGAATFSNLGTLTLDAGTVLSGSGAFQMSQTENVNISISLPAALLVSKTGGTTTGTGILTINGTMDRTGDTLISPFTVAATGTLNILPPASKTVSRAMNNLGAIVWTGGNLGLSNTTFTNSGTLTWSGGSLTLGSSSTLINNGTWNNTFDGIVGTSGGINLFTNSGIFAKTGGAGTTTLGVTTQNTGTFRGNGTISFGTFTNNGTLAPGLSIGTLTVTSSSSLLTAGSRLGIELLDGSGPGTGNDQLLIGSAALNGNLMLTELAAVPAGSYTIVSSTGTLTGTFSSVTQPGGYSVIYNSNSVVVTKTIVLPVTLISFSALRQAAGMKLSWQTAMEITTDHFNIEKSGDGNTFILAGTLAAAGSSNTALGYVFLDRHPLEGVTYYRLQTVDKDGKSVYSKIIKVDREKVLPVVSVAPNPVHKMVTVSGLEEGHGYTIHLINADGQIVMQKKTSGAQVTFNMDARVSGSYWLKIISAEKVITRKLIRQ